MKTGEYRCETGFAPFLCLTAETDEKHKAKLAEIWPEYKERVLELQKVLYVPHPEYKIATNKNSSEAERRRAGNQLDVIRRELKKRVGWQDS